MLQMFHYKSLSILHLLIKYELIFITYSRTVFYSFAANVVVALYAISSIN